MLLSSPSRGCLSTGNGALLACVTKVIPRNARCVHPMQTDEPSKAWLVCIECATLS